MSANMLTNLAEAPHLRMELVEFTAANGDELFALAIDQSLSTQQSYLIRKLLSQEYGIRPIDNTSIFSELEAKNGDMWTDIDCTVVRLGAEAAGHFFNEQNFSREVWSVLFLDGNVVEFDAKPVPIEKSHYYSALRLPED